MPVRLSELSVKITEHMLQQMVEKVLKEMENSKRLYLPIDKEDIVGIFKLAF